MSESKYNQRVNETRRALVLLQRELSITQLAEVTPEQLEACSALFADDELIFRRARHVITEQNRVVQAVDALRASNLVKFGLLMNESHISLRDDYEASSDPLDALFNIALNSDGVLGARLTGAGFGGCTVNLVHSDHVENFIADTASPYQQSTGLSADFYTIKPSQGVRELFA